MSADLQSPGKIALAAVGRALSSVIIYNVMVKSIQVLKEEVSNASSEPAEGPTIVDLQRCWGCDEQSYQLRR